MASATSALHLSPVSTAADLRPSPSSSAFPASASGVSAVSPSSRPVLPARFRRSSHRPVAIAPLSKGTVSKAPHRTRRFRCEAASSGDATSPSSSSSPPEAAPAATPAGGAKGHAFIHDFCFGITFGAAAAVAGVAWFLVTKSADALRLTALFGATIALGGVGSLRAWRKGQSSTPYILGQAGACKGMPNHTHARESTCACTLGGLGSLRAWRKGQFSTPYILGQARACREMQGRRRAGKRRESCVEEP
ncbi:unnamed protein product [Closterium sp. Naga37s-1]|nr:unnamed protein product [Closterium sp. Naga37s-1]